MFCVDMNMKLSQETVVGLKRLCNKSLIPDNTFNDLLQNCAQLITQEIKLNESTLLELLCHHSVSCDVMKRGIILEKVGCDAKMDAVKAAHASLLVLYAEGARHDVDSFMLKTILEEYNLSGERVVPISDTYAKYRSLARQRLQLIGTNLPHIVDVRWRMDYSIKVYETTFFFLLTLWTIM